MTKKNKTLSPEKLAEKQKKREARQFRNKIRNIFKISGFEYLNTEGKHIRIGYRTVEIDFVFIYQNVILLCEDTTTQPREIKDHIRKKQEAFLQIQDNFRAYLDWLVNSFSEKALSLKEYSIQRFKVFNLYFSKNKLGLSSEDLKLYPEIKFIGPQSLNYFYRMSQCIKKSARIEIFRFLGLKTNDIGIITSQSGDARIKAPIIYPEEITGLKNGVHLVSFMMSAGSLLETCYVLRKDNWEESIWLYQRLIEQSKIRSIRSFLISKGTTFFNNIIVALPDSVRFINSQGDAISVEQLDNFEPCKMIIPKEMNSICVIDGQHRIFAHYEGLDNDKTEQDISVLRKKLHLLVTGLIFPCDMDILKRSQIQSEIFLDINTNAKKIPPDVILHIERIKDPFSDYGIARQVIEQLNRSNLFYDKFEMSTLEKGKIKIASIIKFALRYLVTIRLSSDRRSIYHYWNGNKKAIEERKPEALSDYIKYIADTLIHYFCAVKKNNKNAWDDPESKILSVTSINGFIIALTRQLPMYGIKDFVFYDMNLAKMKISYSREDFRYTSSQYRMFSSKILREAFNLDPDIY